MNPVLMILLFSISTAAGIWLLNVAEGDESPLWTPLFDGKTLDGWEHIGPGGFTVKDGVLQTEGGMGLLWFTKQKFGNCQLKVVYKTEAKESNSGVFVRIADRPADPWFAVHHGYEIQICDIGDDYHTTGCLYSLSKARSRPGLPPGEWNTMVVTLDGPRVMVAINGSLVTDFDSTKSAVPERVKDYEPERGPRPEMGYIGVQNHDDAGKETHVWFKEISVEPL